MSKLIRTPYDLLAYEDGEVYDLETQPSLTDPSQAMEIKDILREFSRGGAVRILRSQNYGDDVIPQEFQQITSRMHQMDRTEKAQAILDTKEYINNKADGIDAKKKKAATLKQEAATKKAIAEAVKKAKNPTGDE